MRGALDADAALVVGVAHAVVVAVRGVVAEDIGGAIPTHAVVV